MNVLFYLEPHPIRDSFSGHTWVGKLVCGMLEDELLRKQHSTGGGDDVRLLVSRHHTPALSPLCSHLGSAVVGITREENDTLSMFGGPWGESSIATWKDLMRGNGGVSDFYYSILDRIKKRIFDFDVIVYWGTNGAVRRFADDHDLYSVAMELGCTRTPLIETTYFDPCGVNGDAITQNVDLRDCPPLEVDILRTTLVNPHEDRAFDAEYDPLSSAFTDEIYRHVGRNVLIPLQLDDDSNLLIHSDYEDMVSMLRDVVPKLTNEGYTCYVKPHPYCHVRPITKAGHELCRQYCESVPNVVWLNDINNRKSYCSLLRKMDAVVTINSSVGFEALLYGVPVIPLGRSCYNLPGVFPTLDEFLADDVSWEQYDTQVARILNLIGLHYLSPRYRAFDYNYFVKMVRRSCDLFDVYRNGTLSELTEAILDSQAGTIDDYASYDRRHRNRKRYLSADHLPRQTLRQRLQWMQAVGRMLVTDPKDFTRRVANRVQRLPQMSRKRQTAAR